MLALRVPLVALLLCSPPGRDNAPARFKTARRRFNISELTNTHHVIPRTFRNHPAIVESTFDVNIRPGLMLMPNRRGVAVLRTRRRCHDCGGHLAYNRYVGKRLGLMYKDRVVSLPLVLALVRELRGRIRAGDPALPWV